MATSLARSSYDTITHLLGIRPLFSTPIKLQPESRILTLPAELRLEIYGWLFEFGGSVVALRALALVATCRLIHQEAQRLAFEKIKFLIATAENGLDYHKRMMTLGPVSMHLRHIHINTSISALEPCGGRNPFLLMKLALDDLTIDFGPITSKSWKDDTVCWNNFMSAFLHSSHSASKPRSIQDHIVPRIKRHLALTTWTFAPTRDDLYNTLLRCEAKVVQVKVNKNPDSDMLWFAFRKFNLIDGAVMTVKAPMASGGGTSKERRAGLTFYDTQTSTVMSIERLQIVPETTETPVI
ncbi:hypothetical protein BDV96DRAFT_662005 [Lophiotrema nucula]|uniref:F-box domain-containing protein n=1 Tax=Lophiotrema nucula TaxID=690887 RepID=A0A6A5Z2Q6_9PLEO|nr:hypothetical protein BDV96DRAFT_662005 [Lophiotrema nucula]